MKNNGLSAEEKRVIYAAMERIERKDEYFCCHAINWENGDLPFGNCRLTEKFAEFYDRDTGEPWSGRGGQFGWHTHLGREWRQFLLAWFAEVGPRGVE